MKPDASEARGEDSASPQAARTTPPPSRIQQLKQTLQERGLNPRKTFGQNFMIDPNFAAAIAREASPDERTLIIEVGPGTGLLTRALLDAHPASRVLAIEIDRGLAALLRETFSAEIEARRFELIEGDALAGKHALAPELVERIATLSREEHRPRRVLCANLPYNAGTAILANIALDMQQTGIEAAISTVQLELAQRLLATPAQDEYGGLSALMALRANGKILRRVGHEVFWPRPSIESAVIRLDFKPWDGEGLRRDEAAGFQALLQKLFSQRRKTLRAVLKPQAVPPLPGLKPEARAEELSPAQLLALYRGLGGIQN